MTMRCQICGTKVNVDNSYGSYSFLVCSSCHERLANNNPKNYLNVMNFIFKCGQIRNEIAMKIIDKED